MDQIRGPRKLPTQMKEEIEEAMVENLKSTGP